MPGKSRYKVTAPAAPRRAVDPMIGDIARAMLAEVVARTPHGPTGELAAGWKVVHGRAPAAYLLRNDAQRTSPATGTIYYAPLVEYGTGNHGHAQPMAGPVLAAYRAKVGRR